MTRRFAVDIAILHCHFERGGVTQVVENHVRALADRSDVRRVLLISGDRVGGLSDATGSRAETVTVADLDYDDDQSSSSPALDLTQAKADRQVRAIETALADAGFDRSDAVLHWHNHSLGKNTASPAVVAELASRGWRMLLQVHDFAEDNRPANYRRLIEATSSSACEDIDAYLYPLADQIHYATLTGADAGVLAGLGIDSQQVHTLPNSVALSGDQLPEQDDALDLIRRTLGLPDDARWCLYPVRGIRRKNVGEFVLLSRWLPENCFGGLTLRPTTDVEARSYDRWRKLAADVAPKAVFDAAHHDGVAFMDNLAACDFVLSTSVAEGFGMAFLEPWLARRGVVARRLPGVTDDFTAAGVDLAALYESVPVPGDANWLRQCRQRITASFHEAWSDVPEPFRPTGVEDAPEQSETIDFAQLTPRDQVDVIRRASTSEEFESAMRQHSAELISSLTSPPAETVRRNADVVGREYSIERQGRQLASIYRQLLGAAIEQPGRPGGQVHAVDLVCRARPFYPCRTELNVHE